MISLAIEGIRLGLAWTSEDVLMVLLVTCFLGQAAGTYICVSNGVRKGMQAALEVCS